MRQFSQIYNQVMARDYHQNFVMSYSDHFLFVVRLCVRLLTLSNDNSSKATDMICP